MHPALLDPALVTALLGALGAGTGVAALRRRSPRPEDAERIEYPWKFRHWHRSWSGSEYHAARVRARAVARTTLGPALETALARDGYLDLPSTRDPGTCYRLRPARRVEIRHPAPPGTACEGATICTYLCVYPSYDLPAVEFLAQLYVLLRDDEEHVLATGRPQRYDGSIANVF